MVAVAGRTPPSTGLEGPLLVLYPSPTQWPKKAAISPLLWTLQIAAVVLLTLIGTVGIRGIWQNSNALAQQAADLQAGNASIYVERFLDQARLAVARVGERITFSDGTVLLSPDFIDQADRILASSSLLRGLIAQDIDGDVIGVAGPEARSLITLVDRLPFARALTDPVAGYAFGEAIEASPEEQLIPLAVPIYRTDNTVGAIVSVAISLSLLRQELFEGVPDISVVEILRSDGSAVLSFRRDQQPSYLKHSEVAIGNWSDQYSLLVSLDLNWTNLHQQAQRGTLLVVMMMVLAGMLALMAVILFAKHLHQSRLLNDELIEKEAFFSKVLGAIPGVVFRSVQRDGRWHFVWSSDYTRKLFGVTESAFVASQGGFQIVEDQRRQWQKALSTQRIDNQEWSFEGTFKLASGEEKVLQFRTTQTQSGTDGVEAIGVILDRTDAHALQRELNQVEARLSAVFESARDAILTISDEGLIEDLNQQAADLFEYRREDLVGQPIETLIPTADRSRHVQLRDEFARGKRASMGVQDWRRLRGRRANGEEFPISVSLGAFEIKGRRYTTAVARDMSHAAEVFDELATERQRAQEAADDLEFVLSAARIGVWRWDVGTDRVSWDDRMFLLYGIEPTDFKGQLDDWSNRVHPDDIARAESDLQRGLETGYFESAFRVQKPDGRVGYIRAIARVIEHASGAPTQMIGLNIDVTRLQEALIRAERSAQEAMKASNAKSQFLAMMSHELRTPLNAVIGFSSLLKEPAMRSVSEGKAVEYGALINDAGSQLLDLISDILDYTRIDAGTIAVKPESQRTGPIIDEAKTRLADLSRSRGVTILHKENPAAEAWIDAAAFAQVVTNLLSNAIKYTRENSDVEIIEQVDQSTYTLTVIDQGPGIEPKHRKRVLNPFEQVRTDQSYKSSESGVGLGLAIVNGLLRAHGGRLEIEDGPKGGASISAHFPAPAPTPETLSAWRAKATA